MAAEEVVVLRPPLPAGAALYRGAAAQTKPRRLHAAWIVVAAAVAWNLVSLRAEALGVSYLDDSSVHAQMVRFASALLQHGRLPLTEWFPYLGAGSPMFLHYQSLPSMLTGLLGILVGPDAAFRWTLYLLLAFWPVSVYLAARLFGSARAAAASAAAISPFLVSVIGIGYEQHAYVWTGFGVWTQLWASWTLPLAWALSWRAIRDGSNYAGAVALVSLTIALHFETGYLALMALALWPLVAGRPLRRRLLRAAIVLGGSLLASAWVIVPLIQQREWAAVNESLQGTGLVNGYGIRQVLGWLASGQLLDHGRLPVLTLFAGIGLVAACLRCRRDANARALLAVLAACLLLSSGRTTFGGLVDVIPGSGDIFFRRFMMGTQLAALLLAGQGAAWCGRLAWDRVEGLRSRSRSSSGWSTGQARMAAALAALIAVLAPAWLQLGSYDRRNARAIAAQRHADATDGRGLDRLVKLAKLQGGGRVYAGMPSNWGADFTVGAVPVFKYLESRDVDVVGYTLRTASLMSGPETQFDETNQSDYRLFAIHYLILPAGWSTPVPARLIATAGRYSLWSTESSGYVHVGRIVGRTAANRTNLGRQSIAVLRSGLAQRSGYLRVAYGRAASNPRQTSPPPGVVGSVAAEDDALDHGWVAATVSLTHPAVAVLSASFDPGWTASVDGHPQSTEMVAPALVAVAVPPGTHRVVFRYHGYRHYPILFVVVGLTVATLIAAPRIRRRYRPSGSGSGSGTAGVGGS